MNQKTAIKDAELDRAIITTRLFSAPRELVFKMFTDPKHIVEWWGPRGYTTTVHEMEVKPGGKFRHTMHGPDGTDYPNRMTYKEVIRPDRLSYTNGGGRPGDDVLFEGLITFEDRGGKTLVTMRAIFQNKEERDRCAREYGAVEGGVQTLDRLEEHLAREIAGGEFTISRVFDAPRELVWKAITEPERMKHWWGPKGFTVKVSKMDFRPGGTYHYGLRSPEGLDVWGKFIFRHIVKPERIDLVSCFSDENGGLGRHPMAPNWPPEMLSSFIFTEQAGKTTFTVKWVPFNATEIEVKTFREGMASMQQGWTGTLDQLTEYLTKVE